MHTNISVLRLKSSNKKPNQESGEGWIQA